MIGLGSDIEVDVTGFDVFVSLFADDEDDDAGVSDGERRTGDSERRCLRSTTTVSSSSSLLASSSAATIDVDNDDTFEDNDARPLRSSSLL